MSRTSPAPAVELERVDRARLLAALGAFGRERERFELEGHRHVQAFAPGRAERGDRRGKAVARRKDRFVTQILIELARECGVDLRRLRLRDRVADHGIKIGHRARLCYVFRLFAFRPFSARSFRPPIASA